LTNHRTKLLKRKDKTEFYRSQAKFVFELEADRNILWAAGIIIDNLKKCKISPETISKIEQQFMAELNKWIDFEQYIKIQFALANIVQKKTKHKVYIDVKLKPHRR
jgi:hypothetical protein